MLSLQEIKPMVLHWAEESETRVARIGDNSPQTVALHLEKLWRRHDIKHNRTLRRSGYCHTAERETPLCYERTC